MIAAVCGGVRVVSIYAPNGRTRRTRSSTRPSSPGTGGCSAGWPRRASPASRWSWAATSTSRPTTPTSGTRRAATAARTSRRRSARRSRTLAAGAWSTPTGGCTPSPSATAGGTTAPATSTRTSACASITCWSRAAIAERVVWAEIDREARKGKPIPSDHAPVIIDLDAPGRADRRGLGRRQRAHRRAPHALTRRAFTAESPRGSRVPRRRPRRSVGRSPTPRPPTRRHRGHAVLRAPSWRTYPICERCSPRAILCASLALP